MKAIDTWNADLYDEKHAFVSQFGAGILELLKPATHEHILDVGCGTGDLAAQISEVSAKVIGVDFSENMVQQARTKYPQLTFNVADACNLPFQNEFHAVFSNATLHWIKTPELAAKSIYNALQDGGRFVAEFGGIDNVKIITDALIQEIRAFGVPFSDDDFPWYFPSIGEYTSLLEQVGFHVTFAQHFDRPTVLDGENGMRNWLDMFSPGIFEGVAAEIKEQILHNTIDKLRTPLYKDGTWYADYKRIRVVAYK